MTRRLLAATVLATLALPASALAHVTVSPGEVPAGATLVETFSVPNERDDKATTKIQLQLPVGLEGGSRPVDGWETTISGRTITWTGGRIEGEDRVEFPVGVTIPATEGATLTFKVLQTYEDGEVSRWIGTPDADNPAPVVRVLGAGATAREGESHHEDGGHGKHLAMAGGGAAAVLVAGAGGFVLWRRRRAGAA